MPTPSKLVDVYHIALESSGEPAKAKTVSWFVLELWQACPTVGDVS